MSEISARVIEAARRVATPAYLYDEAVFTERARRLKKKLGAGIRLYYAVKANPALGVMRSLAGVADGADISSGTELSRARRAGFDPRRMSFAGPGKSEAELALAVAAGVGALSLESFAEMERLEGVARRLGKRVSVLIRINPEREFGGFAVKMGGRASPFGVDQAAVPALAAAILERPEVFDLQGFHIYAGAQCLKPETVLDNIDNTLAVVADLCAPLGFRPRLVNLGGGLGIPYHDGQDPLEADLLAAGVRERVAAWRDRTGLKETEAILELGRWLVGPAGLYLVTVTDVKRSRGETFCITDGGMHQFLAASGNFGQVIRRNFPVANLGPGVNLAPEKRRESVFSIDPARDRQPKGDWSVAVEPGDGRLADRPLAGRPRVQVSVTGPLCTSLDLLARHVELPEPRVGDRLAVGMAGAYGLTASPLLFLSHQTPWEYLLRAAGELEVLRQPVDASSLGEPGEETARE